MKCAIVFLALLTTAPTAFALCGCSDSDEQCHEETLATRAMAAAQPATHAEPKGVEFSVVDSSPESMLVACLIVALPCVALLRMFVLIGARHNRLLILRVNRCDRDDQDESLLRAA